MIFSNTLLLAILITLGVVVSLLSIGLFIFYTIEVLNAIMEIKDRRNRRNRRDL